MATYRKRPVEIEAVQWTGDNAAEVRAFVRGCATVFDGTVDPPAFYIHTLEGTMHAAVGDWIIRGVAGELYPCKPEIFAATYDAVTV